MSDVAMTPSQPMANAVSRTSALQWVKANLFSSISNTIQTIVFTVITLGLIRALLGQVFAEDANWSSVATNLRLLMIYNYPADQIIRIWVSAGVVLFATGLSLGAWKVEPKYTIGRLGRQLIGLGVFSLLIRVLLPVHAPESIRTWLVIVGALSLIIGLAVRRTDPTGDRVMGFGTVLSGVAIVFLAVMWLVPFGQYGLVDGVRVAESGTTVASSTKIPWTILLIIVVVSHRVGVMLGRALGGSLRAALAAFWVVGPAFVIFVVLRDPAFDWSHVWSTDIPLGAMFALGGGAVIYLLAAPGRAELARGFGAIMLVFALFNWVAAFFGWYPMLQKVRISFLIFAIVVLLVPAFAGDRSTRRRVAGGWVAAIAALAHHGDQHRIDIGDHRSTVLGRICADCWYRLLRHARIIPARRAALSCPNLRTAHFPGDVNGLHRSDPRRSSHHRAVLLLNHAAALPPQGNGH